MSKVAFTLACIGLIFLGLLGPVYTYECYQATHGGYYFWLRGTQCAAMLFISLAAWGLLGWINRKPPAVYKTTEAPPLQEEGARPTGRRMPEMKLPGE